MCFTRFVLCIVLSCLPVYFLCLLWWACPANEVDRSILVSCTLVFYCIVPFNFVPRINLFPGDGVAGFELADRNSHFANRFSEIANCEARLLHIFGNPYFHK